MVYTEHFIEVRRSTEFDLARRLHNLAPKFLCFIPLLFLTFTGCVSARVFSYPGLSSQQIETSKKDVKQIAIGRNWNGTALFYQEKIVQDDEVLSIFQSRGQQDLVLAGRKESSLTKFAGFATGFIIGGTFDAIGIYLSAGPASVLYGLGFLFEAAAVNVLFQRSENVVAAAQEYNRREILDSDKRD